MTLLHQVVAVDGLATLGKIIDVTWMSKMHNFSQLIYCSVVVTGNSSQKIDDRKSILSSSVSNNLRDELTGVLISTSTHFFQILEGPFPNLMATISRIRRDERHTDFELLQLTRIEDRDFRHWSMASVDLGTDKGKLALHALQRLHAGERRFISTLREIALELAPFCPTQVDHVSIGATLD